MKSCETHEVSTNIRFNITYRPLSDIYLVYNDRRSLGHVLMERAFIVKVTCRQCGQRFEDPPRPRRVFDELKW